MLPRSPHPQNGRNPDDRLTPTEGWEPLPASVREQVVDAYVLRDALFQAVPVTPCRTGS